MYSCFVSGKRRKKKEMFDYLLFFLSFFFVGLRNNDGMTYCDKLTCLRSSSIC